MKKLVIYSISATLSLAGLSSCNKLLEVTPENETLVEDALKTPRDLQNLLNSCYDVTANAMNGRTQIFNELLGDNLIQPLNNDNFREIFTRSTNFFNETVGNLYGDFYICVYRVNVLNQEIDNVPGVSATEKQRILAEASFLRALAHFELVKLWAQPYGYSINNGHAGIALRKEASQTPIGRSDVAAVYAYILEDLNNALAGLPDVNGNYADKDAARALLAKVHFQMGDYPNAAKYAGDVINSGRYQLSDSINRFDNAGSASEYVFKFVSTSNNDNRARAFVDNFRSNNNATPQLRMSTELYSLLTFRASDKRGKLVRIFNPGTENEFIATTKFNEDFFSIPYLHLTEMMLTRIESLARLNQNLTVAIDDLNEIMERAYGPGVVVLPAQSGANDVLNTVLLERRLELFGEGDRIQQLKRLGAAGEPIQIRNAPWNCPGMILQFPVSERTTGFVLNVEGGCN